MMQIGFTGTRHGMTIPQHEALVKIFLSNYKLRDEVVLHHGMCIGADLEAHRLAKIFDFGCVGHPPTDTSLMAEISDLNKRLPPKYYLDRNQDIVNDTSTLIATPKEFEEVRRSGTWATIRYGARQKKHVVVINPAGYTSIYRCV